MPAKFHSLFAGPVSMLQLCYREPWKEEGKTEGALKLYLFHLPSIGGLYDVGRKCPVLGSIEGNRAFDKQCTEACADALALMLPGFLQDEDLIKVGVNVFSDVRKMMSLLPDNSVAKVAKDKAVRGGHDRFQCDCHHWFFFNRNIG